VPLLRAERALGVLEVLDRRERSRTPLEELVLLELFARQAAIALDLLTDSLARTSQGDEEALLEGLPRLFGRLRGERRKAARQLLEAPRVLAGP